jgi:hypothetical protein
MSVENIIKKRLKRLKENFPGTDEKQIERELIPVSGEEIQPITTRKKKRN